MVSFSFEAVSPVANVSAKAKGARADNGPANEDFGSLIDSNAADAASSETPASTDRIAPVQRSDETRPASEPGKPREPTTKSDKSSAEKPAANKTASDNGADTEIDASVAIETPIKATVDAGISIATDLLSPDIVIAADATADADADVQLPTDQGTVATGLLAVIAQTGIVPVVAAPIAPSVETTASTTATTGVASIAATAIATVAATVEADVQPVAPPATPANPASDDSKQTNAVATQASAEVTAELTASIDTPLTSEEQTLLTDAAKLATNAKSATGVSGDVAVDTETTPQIKLASSVGAKVETAQSERKPVAEPNADKTVAASADNSAETIAKPEQSEATAAKGVETRAQQTGAPNKAADADVPVQANAQPSAPAGGPIPAHLPAATTAAPVLNASVQLASNVAVPLSGLAVNIALNANAGRSSFDIRLDPAELGRIDVRLDVDRHGNVTSHLTVERPSTLDLLRRDAPQLQRALEDAGLKTGDNGLQFSLRDQSQQQRTDDDQSQHNSYRLVVDDVTAIPAEAGRTYARLAAARGGVDIRI